MSGDTEVLNYECSLQVALLKECHQLLDKKETSSKKVIQIGCGLGATTSLIAQSYPNVHEVLGVEENQSSVDYAFTYVADEVMNFARGKVEDETTFDLGWAAKFDFVFATHALLFVRDHATALRNLMWCLKPGGKCFLAVPASKPEDFHEAAKKIFTADVVKKQFKDSTEAVSELTDPNCNRLWFHHPHADRVYSALLEQVGFQVLSTKLLDFQYIFPSEEQYKDCIRCLTNRTVQHLPEQKQAAILKQFCKIGTKKAKKAAKGTLLWNVKYAIVLAKRPEL